MTHLRRDERAGAEVVVVAVSEGHNVRVPGGGLVLVGLTRMSAW